MLCAQSKTKRQKAKSLSAISVGKKLSDLVIGWLRSDLVRRSDLRQPSSNQYGHAIGNLFGLFTIVRDVQHGHAQRLLDVSDLSSHAAAQLCVEVAERFVEQEHLWLHDQAAGERHALLLAARQLVWIFVL